MIRTWVKNLCNAIDNLDVSSSTDARLPIINDKVLRCRETYFMDKYVYYLYVGENIEFVIDIEESEYILLKDSFENFRNKVNEARTIEFLKPFI